VVEVELDLHQIRVKMEDQEVVLVQHNLVRLVVVWEIHPQLLHLKEITAELQQEALIILQLVVVEVLVVLAKVLVVKLVELVALGLHHLLLEHP
jgi:hypothetical protein